MAVSERHRMMNRLCLVLAVGFGSLVQVLMEFSNYSGSNAGLYGVLPFVSFVVLLALDGLRQTDDRPDDFEGQEVPL